MSDPNPQETLVSKKKKKYDSEGSKRRLMRAAMDIFSKDGYDCASTRNIAKKAKVNDALIHRYFKSKLGLFFAILKEFHSHVTSDPPYPPSDSVQEEIANFFKFRLEFCCEHQKFFRLGITRAIIDPKVRQEMGMLARNGTPGLTSRLERLRANGKIRTDINLESLSLLISAISFSMSMMTYVVFKYERETTEPVLELAAKLLSESLKP